MQLGAWRWPLLCFLRLRGRFFSAVAPDRRCSRSPRSARAGPDRSPPRNLTLDTLPGRRCSTTRSPCAASSTASGWRRRRRVLAVLIGACIAYIDLRTEGARTPAARLSRDPAAGAAGHGHGGRHPAGLHSSAASRSTARSGSCSWPMSRASCRSRRAAPTPPSARSIPRSRRRRGSRAPRGSHTIRYVLLPLARPGLIVAFLLVFIPAFGELSATILLYTGGTETIAVAIFRLNDLGQLEVVSALAVFTIAVILVVSLAAQLAVEPRRARGCRLARPGSSRAWRSSRSETAQALRCRARAERD